MPSLADLKRRIKSVKNTQKITKAMKLVSASKYSKALTAVTGARPYFKAFAELSAHLAEQKTNLETPLLRTPTEKDSTIGLIVVSTDRGLCGGLNANLFKKVDSWVKQKKESCEVDIHAWGSKASRLFARRYSTMLKNKRSAVLEKPTFIGAKALAKEIVDLFKSQKLNAVYIAYPKFVTAIAQLPTVEKLLPFDNEFVELLKSKVQKNEESQKSGQIIFEPSAETMIEKLLERQLVGQVYATLLEARACEHGARMSAMDSATRNAQEVIKKLTLKFNRARQASITKELIEIVSGAEAL